MVNVAPDRREHQNFIRGEIELDARHATGPRVHALPAHPGYLGTQQGVQRLQGGERDDAVLVLLRPGPLL